MTDLFPYYLLSSTNPHAYFIASIYLSFYPTISLPLSLSFSLSQVVAMGTGKDVIKYSLYSGLSFYLYNEASFLALERLSTYFSLLYCTFTPNLLFIFAPSPSLPHIFFLHFITLSFSVWSSFIISLLGPVTHSVANTLKRVVIIVASCIVFKSPMSLLGKEKKKKEKMTEEQRSKGSREKKEWWEGERWRRRKKERSR